MNYTLNNINSAHALLVDIIVITKATLSDHETEKEKILEILDKENLAKSVHNYEFLQKEIIWLRYKISPNGIIPKGRKQMKLPKWNNHTN